MIWKKLFVTLVCGTFPAVMFSQKEASIRYYQLAPVTIRDTAAAERHLEQSSVRIDKMVFDKQGITSVGEAAKFIPGVSIKDYGGLGGLKTISIRGLGSTHTAILYDGIAVSDYMNGQIDLSKYALNNVKEVNMTNGQDFNILQSAKAMASSNVFMIETSSPYFEKGESFNANAYCSYGSFNYFNSGFGSAKRFNEKWVSKLDFDLINSAGNYPYRLHYGRNKEDSVSDEVRKNADVLSARIEWNNFIVFSPKTDLKIKAYYFYSNRGLPSATIYYYQNKGQRLWDKNAFVQSVLTHKFSCFTYRNRTKVSADFTHYLDNHVLNISGFQSDIYRQREAYTNNVISFEQKNIKMSLTNDLSLNNLISNGNIAVSPLRLSALTAMVVDFGLSKLRFNANIMHSYYRDNTNYARMASVHSNLHPFASVAFKTDNFAISLFYKDIMRMPTFNELYYNRIGDPTLKPERTRQLNLHTAYANNLPTKHFVQINTSIDAYYNKVLDKIVAMPQRNLFIWSMLNYGKVFVGGIDALLGVRTNIKNLDMRFQATYSLQYAVDNEERSITYRQQIPYTPRNSGSFFALVAWKSCSFSYTLSFVGRRYALNENIAANRLDAYADHSINISKTFRDKLTLSFSILNLLGQEYEVVRNYPMPLRQFRIKINYKLNK
ncbi:MAG: TonB-dependent receptor [Bacteroidales bacterium]|nr:TonB-dependent receptor [Bacteroidales bacterium]